MSQRNRPTMVYRRKNTSAAASYFKRQDASKYRTLRINQRVPRPPLSQRLSDRLVKARSTVPRSVQTAVKPRSWSRKDFGQNDPSHNVCTFSSLQSTAPLLKFIDSRSHEIMPLTAMVGRTATGQVNLRKSNCIHLYGIKLFLDVQNQVDQILNFEYSISSPKNGDTLDTVNYLTAEGLLARGQTIDGKSALDLKSAKINSDESFVFLHKRVQLLHQPDTTGGHTDGNNNIKFGASFRQIYEYIPINRKISWDSMTDTISSDPIFLSLWCYTKHELAGAAKISSALVYQCKAILLYKNIDT